MGDHYGRHEIESARRITEDSSPTGFGAKLKTVTPQRSEAEVKLAAISNIVSETKYDDDMITFKRTIMGIINS